VALLDIDPIPYGNRNLDYILTSPINRPWSISGGLKLPKGKGGPRNSGISDPGRYRISLVRYLAEKSCYLLMSSLKNDDAKT